MTKCPYSSNFCKPYFHVAYVDNFTSKFHRNIFSFSLSLSLSLLQIVFDWSRANIKLQESASIRALRNNSFPYLLTPTFQNTNITYRGSSSKGRTVRKQTGASPEHKPRGWIWLAEISKNLTPQNCRCLTFSPAPGRLKSRSSRTASCAQQMNVGDGSLRKRWRRRSARS